MQKAKTLKITPSNKYSKRWIAAKAKFKRVTGEKYPATTKPITLFGQQITRVREGQGIEKALKAIESAASGATKTAKGLRAFGDAVDKYNQVYPQYLNVLAGVVNHTPPGVNANTHKQALAFLKSELEDISRAVKDEKIKARMLRDGNAALEQAADDLVGKADRAADAALVWINQQRHNPDAQAFNHDIEQKARNITQHIGNVRRYQVFGFEITHEQPDAVLADLEQWSDKNRQVDDDADAQAVLNELREFENAVLYVKQWAR